MFFIPLIGPHTVKTNTNFTQYLTLCKTEILTVSLSKSCSFLHFIRHSFPGDSVMESLFRDTFYTWVDYSRNHRVMWKLDTLTESTKKASGFPTVSAKTSQWIPCWNPGRLFQIIRTSTPTPYRRGIPVSWRAWFLSFRVGMDFYLALLSHAFLSFRVA